MDTQRTIFSGIQPTGKITIGNYLGALKNWVALQDEYRCIYCVVDLHSITVSQVPSILRQNTYDLISLYIACGLDPKKNTLFIQSHVPAHCELTWVLNTMTYIGEISRMTQFKDKSAKHQDNLNVGLLDYPVLMASDILLYNTDLVPIGSDQKQHLELARDIAVRFNGRYSETFVVPEPFIPKAGAKIMSLADPTFKMSKSDTNENGYITMSDEPEVIMRKFKKAVTDSDNKIAFSEQKAGVSNLLTIYSLFAEKPIAECELEFENVGYGDFKIRVAESVIEGLRDIQAEQKRIVKDKGFLDNVLKEGAIKAEAIANKTLAKVYKKVGFLPRMY